jgi:transcriptional regulator with XRE-family HTH domain
MLETAPRILSLTMARAKKTKASAGKDTESESLGKRLARLRKEKGFTQIELAEKAGIIQAIVSDYERGKLRPHAEMVARLAVALGVSADELLGLAHSPKPGAVDVDRRLLRRLHAIGRLPKRDQDALLRTIDAFLGKQEAS